MTTPTHTPDVVGELEGTEIGDFRVSVTCQPRRRVGHFDIDVVLRRAEEHGAGIHVVTGIYSVGHRGRSIGPWLDIHFLDILHSGEDLATWSLQEEREARELFSLLGAGVGPGGMIMVAYTTDLVWDLTSPVYRLTRRGCRLRTPAIPPAATPLGALLAVGGCLNVKSDGYNVHGSSRLAGERAPSERYEHLFRQRLRTQLEEYLGTVPVPELGELEDICRENAIVLLDWLDDQGALRGDVRHRRR
jgi:hypothetical protein